MEEVVRDDLSILLVRKLGSRMGVKQGEREKDLPIDVILWLCFFEETEGLGEVVIEDYGFMA